MTKVRRLAMGMFGMLLLTGCAMTPPDNTGNTGNMNDNAGNENMNANGGNDNGGMMAEARTVTFEGDGGATSNGTTNFAFEEAMFAGGTVRSLGIGSLYGSGFFAYEVLDGTPATVTFNGTAERLELFFASRGAGTATLTAFDGDGGVVGTVTAASSDSSNEEKSQIVTLSAPAARVEIVHTGDGDSWVDDFTFQIAQ